MTIHHRTSLVAGLLLGTTFLGCAQHSPDARRAPVPVKVRTVDDAAADQLARFSGSLEPAVKVDLAFRVGGYVEKLGEVAENGTRRPLDKGDFVKKGTFLAKIRSSDYAQKVATTAAEINQARADAKLADAELDRYRRMLESHAISRADYDSRVAKAESTRAGVAAAVARQGEAGVSLSDTVLTAPMDGVILTRSAEVGTLVSQNQTVITVADTRTVKATFGVPQALVEKLHEGDPVQVYVGADTQAKTAEKMVDAKITRIAPSADTKGRVFAIEAALPNDDGALRAGSVIAARIPEGSDARTGPRLEVPLSAIVRSPKDPRGFAVFVLDGQGERVPARLHDVHLGEIAANAVTVRDGVVRGDRVVTVGATLLQDGSDAVVIR